MDTIDMATIEFEVNEIHTSRQRLTLSEECFEEFQALESEEAKEQFVINHSDNWVTVDDSQEFSRVDEASVRNLQATPAPTHPYVAVTGRIEGDDEDTALVFSRVTYGGAITAFSREIIQARQCGDEDGEAPEVIVTSVMTSESPIRLM